MSTGNSRYHGCPAWAALAALYPLAVVAMLPWAAHQASQAGAAGEPGRVAWFGRNAWAGAVVVVGLAGFAWLGSS